MNIRGIVIVMLAVALAGCGARAELVYPKDARGPAVPQGAAVAPTPTQLTEPTVEARPDREDEALRQSRVRAADPFDLPPER